MTAFLDDDIGACVSIGETEGLGKPGNEDYRNTGLLLANPGDQLDAVEIRHLIVRDHQVEHLTSKLMQSLDSTADGGDLVAELLKNYFSRSQAQFVIIYQQNSLGHGALGR